MFEDKTFEAIRDQILESIDDSIDKREGSVIYDATVYIAPKIAELYSFLDVFLSLAFADTADGEYLTLRAAEFGVYRKLATQAVRKGVFRDSTGALMDIPLNTRFAYEDATFLVSERISVGEYKLTAEQTGTGGNSGSGEIIPLQPVTGLGSAVLTDVLVSAIDEESDDSLKNRLKIRVQRQATSGNVYHYEQWALSVPNVGGVKVLPVWNGPNTVKVVLVSNESTAVTQGTIDEAVELIEKERPIGAIVTVVSAVELPVNVTATLTLAPGATVEDVESQFTEGLREYLQSIAFKTNDITGEAELIRYTRIANILLDLPPIIDYTDLLVNGGTVNIQPATEQVPVMGTVTFT
ncbi:baseplate J/gp47 family protein [Mesobacillus stamsii]|uniref:Phage protein gp47/JayE n=1 Tax=Mesobacillus stamsii TaxID=225347 RepID=A0ABU0FTP4_9BACI|nr:baseplate J/gp47 family protein [Mesobacillus stamsii]MDQ0412733.1 putative phage protein gp47/JayE [Mesobacillus stamsii]